MAKHQDVTLGVVILIFCAASTALSMRLSGGSEVMPIILTGIMAFLGVLILVDGLKKTQASRRNGEEVHPFVTVQSLKTPYKMFCQIVAYAVLFYLVGFYAATVIFLLTSMRYLGQRSWKAIVLLSVGFVAFTYFFLARELNVSIDPLGVLGLWFQTQA